MSRRLCFVLDLVNDAAKIAEYEAFHRPGRVWPVIVDDIRAQGIEGMEIWRSGDRMVMIATVADDYPRARAVPPEHDQWEALMWRFRWSLTSEKRALTKFLACVDWGDAQVRLRPQRYDAARAAGACDRLAGQVC